MDKFQYYLTDEDGKFYYLDLGTLKLSVDPIALPHAPSGWDEISLLWERGTKYGILKTFSLPLRFTMEGARILRELFYNANIEKEVHVLISKQEATYNSTTFRESNYQKFYEGEIDFSTFKDGGPEGVTVSISESGFAKKLKANESTPYEILLEAPDRIRIKMDGIFLQQKFNYLIQSGFVNQDHVIGTIEANSEGGGAGLARFTVYSTEVGAHYQDVDWQNRAEYFLTATQDISDVRIRGTIKYTATVTSGHNHAVYIINSRGEVVAGLGQTPYGAGQIQGSFPFDVTIDVEQGQSYFMVGQATFITPIIYQESTFTVEFKSRYTTSYIYAYKPLDYWKKLVNKALGANIGASSLLDDNANYCVTCGDAVRGLEDPKIKWSINNCFEAFNTVLNAGMSLENNQLLLESKDRYFSTIDPIQLQEVKDLKVSVATDYMANTIKIGYPEKQIDDVNGKYAFNNTHIYSGPQTRVVKEFALVAPVVTDPFAIENYRLNLEGKTTTDNSSDNEVILLDVDLDSPQSDNLGTYYNLKRETYTSISGLPDPDTTFNVRFSPKTLLFTHQRWIDSMFYGFENEDLKFQTTEKNFSLTRTIGGQTIDEDADFTITDDPYFLNIIMEMDSIVPIDLNTKMDLNPNRCVQFPWRGETWEGFVLRAGMAPNDNKSQTFKVLLTPNNDLTKLI